MYQDIFIEETVKRNTPSFSRTLWAFMVVFAVISAVLSILSWGLFFIPTIIFIALAYWQKGNLDIQFDYSYTNGELDIARVTGGRKRKVLASIDEQKIEVLAPSKNDALRPYAERQVKTIDCTSHTPGRKYYVLYGHEGKKDQDIRLLFEPGEELIDMLHRMNPSKVTV